MMAVHWNPAVRYIPQNVAERELMGDVASGRRPQIIGNHYEKCPKCKKRMRGVGHDCRNGK